MKLKNEDESGIQTYNSVQSPNETEIDRKKYIYTVYIYIYMYTERESQINRQDRKI